MSNAQFWRNKKGFAVQPTVCPEPSLKIYHPSPKSTPARGSYGARIKEIDPDVFSLRLFTPDWSKDIRKDIKKLEFRPGDKSYKYLEAYAPPGISFGGFDLKKWVIEYETKDGKLEFIDHLYWEKASNNFDHQLIDKLVEERKNTVAAGEYFEVSITSSIVPTSWRWQHNA